MKEVQDIRRGPGTYSPEFKQTERRVDIGIMKIKEPINEKKEEIDTRLPIFPNYDVDKPNKLVFQYHEPTKGLEPPHTPEKEIFQGNWRYYDVNLDAIKAEVAKDIYFGGKEMSQEEFLSK